MVETFPFCYLCELIDEDCHELTLAIFYSNWIDATKRYQSTIFIFLYQTQQSIKFIAGGIFAVSIRTNIEVRSSNFVDYVLFIVHFPSAGSKVGILGGYVGQTNAYYW